MTQTLQIDWAEYREIGDGQFELYFVEATETAACWALREPSTFDLRWFPVPLSQRLVLIAERGKAAISRSNFRTDGDFCVRSVVDGPAPALIFGPRQAGSVAASTVLAMVRFRSYHWLPQLKSHPALACGVGPVRLPRGGELARPMGWVSSVGRESTSLQ
jgi:hypothetical protein